MWYVHKVSGPMVWARRHYRERPDLSGMLGGDVWRRVMFLQKRGLVRATLTVGLLGDLESPVGV